MVFGVGVRIDEWGRGGGDEEVEMEDVAENNDL